LKNLILEFQELVYLNDFTPKTWGKFILWRQNGIIENMSFEKDSSFSGLIFDAFVTQVMRISHLVALKFSATVSGGRVHGGRNEG
jgi:hypothetical protein